MAGAKHCHCCFCWVLQWHNKQGQVPPHCRLACGLESSVYKQVAHSMTTLVYRDTVIEIVL